MLGLHHRSVSGAVGFEQILKHMIYHQPLPWRRLAKVEPKCFIAPSKHLGAKTQLRNEGPKNSKATKTAAGTEGL